MNKLEIVTMTVGMVSTNCYLAINKAAGQLFIVDPGGEADRIIERIREVEGDAVPAAILLTHGHFDHILAIPKLLEEYQVPLYACEAEQKMLSDPKLNMSGSYSRGLSVTAEHLLKDGEEFQAAGVQIRCIHTPGHTPGSCCYYLPDEGILFSGDTLFKGSIGRTDFPGGSTKEILDSLKGLLHDLPEDTMVYPGHEGPTSIGYETRYNPFV